jgi:hypothetical protein
LKSKRSNGEEELTAFKARSEQREKALSKWGGRLMWTGFLILVVLIAMMAFTDIDGVRGLPDIVQAVGSRIGLWLFIGSLGLLSIGFLLNIFTIFEQAFRLSGTIGSSWGRSRRRKRKPYTDEKIKRKRDDT